MRVNESGRSMIEMLGVLAIIGVLSVGGIAGYSKAMNKFKTNKVADQVSMIVTNIRTLYAQQTTYAGLNNSTAISMGVIPDELGTTGSTLTNPFNGNVYVNSAVAGANMAGGSASDTKAFIVSYSGLSREACVTLATNDWGSGYSSGLIGLKVYGINITDVSDDSTGLVVGCDGFANIACAGGSTSAVPFQVSQAATACACGTANTCSITWKFY